MKAWMVFEKGCIDDGIDVVWADTPGKAKQRSMFNGSIPWNDIRVRRAAELDNEQPEYMPVFDDLDEYWRQ